MRRLNLSFFMNLGAQLDLLTRWDAVQKADAYRAAAFPLRDSLRVLLQYDVNPMQLPATYPEAQELINAIDRLVALETANQGDVMTVWLQATKLQTILLGEMAVQAAYHIWPKRAYDTNRLIGSAISIFPEWVSGQLREQERYDIDQAGKCLAFEVPTAAAFHLIRLTEAVLRRYYAIVVGATPKPKMRNWGTYIKNLRAFGASEKVLFAIEQVKELYRNPVIHPEEKLSMDEAVSLLGIVETAVTTMHADIAQRLLPPNVSLFSGGAAAA